VVSWDYFDPDGKYFWRWSDAGSGPKPALTLSGQESVEFLEGEMRLTLVTIALEVEEIGEEDRNGLMR
jgi:hypothetical protein